MKPPILPSLGARRTKHGLGRRFTWAMGVLAVLLAALALAVPLHGPVSADEPDFTINVSDINYETATASFTVTNLPSSINANNWIAGVKYDTPFDPYGYTLTTGTGQDRREFTAEFTVDPSGGTVTANSVPLTRLIPDSQYTLTITIYEKVGVQWPIRAQGSTTFTSKSGCMPSPEPNHKDPESISPTRASWFGIYEFRHVTETEFMLEVSLNPSFEWKHAPVNSGACVYYKYNEPFGTFQSGILTAYIHDNLSGGKRGATIRHTGLTPATRYNFRLTMDKESDVGDITVSGTTLGPNTGISDIAFTDITDDSTDATATIEHASMDPKFVYWHYRTSPINGEPGSWSNTAEDSTEGATFPIALNSLDAGTRYELEASVKKNFNPNMSMTKAFVTLPGKPGISPLEAGDGSLKVTWTAPTETPAPLTGYRVQWQEHDEYFDYNTFPPPTSTLDYDAAAADVTNHTIENLTNGTKYVVIVIAKNASFDDFGGTASDYETGTPMTLPNAPNKLQVVPGIKKLTLTWEEPAAKVGVTVTGYVVEYKKDADTTWTQNNVAVVPDTSSGATTYGTTVPSLDHSTEYDVRVRANNGVTSDDYNWTEGSETTLPDKPTGLAVESGNLRLTLSWEEPSDLGSVSISDYVVQYRKTSETSWTTSSATNQESLDSLTSITTYSNTFTALDYSTEYDVRVRADNDVTLQDEDNYNWAEDDGQTIPDSPVDLGVTPGNESLTLTWKAPADSGSISISGYIVQYKKTADSGWNSLTPLSAAALGTTIHNLDNNDLYFVRVRAVNTAELDEEDDYNWAREEGTPVPSPSIETVTVDANSVTQTEATVTVTLDRTNDVTQKVYLQYQSVPNGGWSTPPKPGDIDATSGDIVLDTLEGNTEYEVQAWLETDVNTKVKSELFTTKPVPPGAPINTAVTPGDTIIELSWDPPLPADNGGASVTHYVIEWVEYLGHNWETSTLQSGTPTDEEYEITGLTNGTRYAIRLRADNLEPLPAGKSYNWVFIDATPRTIPAAPTVTVTADDAKLHVRWNKPDNGGNAISGFVVQYSDDEATWKPHGEPGSNTTDTTIPNLVNGTEYFVRVRAKNDAEPDVEGEYNWGDDLGTPRTIPAKPKITVTPGNTVLEVRWDEPDDGGNDITGHVVQYKKNTDDGWVTSSATIAKSFDAQTEITSYKTTISTPENGTLYDVRVRAVNEVVLDDEENYKWGTGSGKPITIPAEPTVGVTPGNARLEVNWNKPANGGDTITGFVVQYMKDSDTDWRDHSTPGPNDTATTISSLDNGGFYTVRVRAVNSVVLDVEDNYSWGDDSGTPRTIPNKPTSVDVTHGDKLLTVTWEEPDGTLPNDGGDTITEYEIQWKEKNTSGWSSPSEGRVSASAPLELAIDEHLSQPLTNGTTYEVRVRAVNAAQLDPGQIYNWEYGEETPSTTPGAPLKVRMSNQGDKELKVEWDAPDVTGGDNISGYVVQWRVKGIANWEATSTTEAEINNATTFSHTFNQHLSTDLANGLSYEARVIAKNRNGRGTPSPVVEGKPRTTPDAPDDLQVTEGNTELALTWTAPTETGGVTITIDYYFVEYKKEGENSFTSKQTDDASTNWTLDGLENGKLYTIQVKAHNSEGDTSEPSGQATGKPRTIPGKPTITGITVGNRTLTVAWTAPTDNGGAAPTKYIIEWEEWIESSSTWQASGSKDDNNGSPSEIGSLANGTLYRVVVKAHNAAGTGPASDPEEGTPKTIPDAPAVTLTPGDSELMVEWTKPDNGGDAITGFKVQYKKDTDEKWTELSEFGAAVLGTTITSLDNGDLYKVWVRAVNTAEPDAGPVYNWGKESDTPRTFPAAPSVSLEHGDEQLKVTWDKPDKRGATITGFVVQYKEAADTPWLGHSTPGPEDTTTDITGLDNGVLYDVRVRAVNSVTLDDEDNYAWGKESKIPRTIPGPVTELGIISGDEELTVSWVAPTVENNGGAAVKRYVLQWKSGNEEYDPDSNRHTTTTDVSKVLKELSNGILYSIRVRADNDETADIYKWVEKTGTPMSVPGAPTGLGVEEGDEQLVVSWVAPEETGGVDVEIEHYVIQWKLKTDSNWDPQDTHETRDETVLRDTITGLDNGEMYDIRVRADNNVEGQTFQWANTTGRPRTIPSEPRNLRKTEGDGQISLSWNAPSETGGLNINQYVVQWKWGSLQYNNSDRQDATPNRSYTIRGLDNDVLHTFRVRADNTVTVLNEEDYNWAPETGTPVATPNPPPPPPPTPNNNPPPPPQRAPDNPTPPVIKAPEISSVRADNITKTTARAVVDIDHHDGTELTVELRYQLKADVQDWTTDVKTAEATSTASPVTKNLADLTPGTEYVLQASLDDTFLDDATREHTFTTKRQPNIQSVSADNITKTTARAVVNIDDHDGTELTVELRYQVKADVQDWTTDVKTAEATSTASPATKNLADLTPGTEYVLQASFDDTFPDDATREHTFTTKRQPSIQSVIVSNVGRTSARATINIADSDGSTQTAKLQYRITSPQGQWSTPALEQTSTDATVVIDLDSLTADTGYEVQAWLATDATNKKTDTFRTSQAQQQRSPVVQKPSISSVTFINIMQTSAVTNVSLQNAGTGQKIVRLHYRADGTTSWSTPPKTSKTKSSGTTISLTGLTAGTTYEVQVWLNSGTPPSGTQIYEFTTLEEVVSDPSISNLEFENIGQTSATAMVKIADAGTDMKEVYLKHSIQGEDNWSMLPTPTTTYRDSASIALDGLQEQTIYEVAVALSGDFNGMTIGTFTTLAGPSLSGVSISGITQTSAVATVNIEDAGTAQKTVSLRHRRFGETEWDTARTKTTTDESAAFDLTGLSPQTKYEVEAALSSDFTDSATATFTTLSPDPRLSNVIVRDIKQTTATAAIAIADPGDTTHTVYLHYRTTPQGEWSETQTANSNTVTIEKEESNGEISTIVVGRARVSISGLTAATEYEVQVSLDSGFDETVSATFTTLRYPSISDVDVTDITKTTATSKIDIADPDGSSQTVHLRYRTTTPQGDWSGALTTTSTTAEASINLTGLITDTEYEVEVSLTSDFTVAVSDTFRTLPPEPVVSKVSVNSIRQTTATAAIDIANTNGSRQTVSLRYRTTTPRGEWSDIQTTISTTDSASIDLSGLTPGTEYDVQASLDSSFPTTRTKSATFTTLRGPSIASFEAENIGRNGATVSALIADSHGVAQTVYVRHRDVRYSAWKPTQQTDSVDDVASIRLRGLSSGTEYIAEASLDNSFPDGGTRSVTFTTKEREEEEDGSSSVGGDVAQAARAANVPLLGFSPQMLRFTAIEGGDNPPPQAFLVWNRAQGAMSFTLSNQQEWLSQQPTSGVSNGPDDQVTITASVDSSALASGQYVDIINIDVSSSGKSPAQVIVVLDVLPPDYIRQFVSRDEGGVVVLPDGTVKIVVQPLAPPKDVDIELMKVNLQAHGQPPGEKERVVVAIESNTYPPGGDTPEDVAYAPYVELWVQLPQEDAAACDEGKTRVYSVEAETWSLVEHRCETDESDKVWIVAQVERLGAFALVIDDAPVSPTPTPVAAAVAATATAIPASAPAVAVQRISLPAQPPTPVPTSVPTAVPMPNGKTTVAPAMAPTPTAVPAGNEPSAPMMQASAGDGGSGGFGRIILAALGVPMLIGTLIVVYLLYRERRRRDDARMI